MCIHGGIFTQDLCNLLTVHVPSELLCASDKNKGDFVFTFFCCSEFYHSDRREINLTMLFSP